MKKVLARFRFDNSKNNLLILSASAFILLAIPLTVYLIRTTEDPLQNASAAATRDPLKQPFASNSPWNMPIGSGAQYQALNLPRTSFIHEWNMPILAPSSPLRQITAGSGNWWPMNCSTTFTNRGNFPIPDGYVVPPPPGAGDGTYPNRAGGVLGTDNKIYEFQYAFRCSSTGNLVAGAWRCSHNIYGSGVGCYGAHGGSGISGVGGALRKWEVDGTEPIKHALKFTVPPEWLSSCNNGWRWPAMVADSGYNDVGGNSHYSGSICDMRMGSLVALPPSYDCNSPSTSLGKRVCQTLKDYGAYIADINPGWDPISLNAEWNITWPSGFSSNFLDLVPSLNVIRNNTSSNIGGGGTPRVPLSDDLCPTIPCSTSGDTINPTATLIAPANGATVSGTSVALTATATDNVGVASVQFFVDNQSVNTDTSSPYSYSWNSTTKANGTYQVYARATDAAGNSGSSATINITVNNTTSDTTPPTLSNGSPSGVLAAGTTSTTMSVTTNEASTCKYGTTSGVAFSSIANTFSTTGSTNHSVSITGLTNGVSRTYYVRCRDLALNANSSDYTISFSVASGSTSLPSPWQTADIGSVGVVGSAGHSSGTFTVAGSGDDIWNTADAFRFVYQDMTGDGTITARVVSQTNTDPWAKAAVMIRENLTAGSKNAISFITPGNGTNFQYRSTAGAEGTFVWGSGGPMWVRLQRAGNTITGYRSSDGTNWTTTGSTTISMTSTVKVGLAVTSHNNSTLSSVTFSNVSVNQSSSVTGDLNNDGRVNVFDASILFSRWGTSDSTADLNRNGTVDIFDSSILFNNWTG